MSDNELDAYGPFNSHEAVARKFEQLNPEVKKFLSKLGDDDAQALEDAVSFWKELRTFTKWVRWLILGVFTLFVSMVSLLKGWEWIVAYLKSSITR